VLPPSAMFEVCIFWNRLGYITRKVVMTGVETARSESVAKVEQKRPL
jgi:hypothetical protein